MKWNIHSLKLLRHFFNRRPQSARCRMPRAQNCRHHSRFLLCMLENQTEHDSILCREGFRSFWLMSCSPESFCMNRQITIILSFLSKNRDYAEIRGTFPGRKFHDCWKISKDRFWAYREIGFTPQKAYVCESAIDALSLCLLRQYECHKFLFCSIGGVANQSAIDRIKRFLPVIIAVDNDDAGERCRKNNPDVPFIIPTAKDWNDDLQMLKQSRNKSKT